MGTVVRLGSSTYNIPVYQVSFQILSSVKRVIVASAGLERGSMICRRECPFCGEPIKRQPPDYIDVCPEHGVLEGISDEEWALLKRERT